MATLKKTFTLEIEVSDTTPQLYPNYRFNFSNRGQFVKFITNEMKNIVGEEYGVKIKIIPK